MPEKTMLRRAQQPECFRPRSAMLSLLVTAAIIWK